MMPKLTTYKNQFQQSNEPLFRFLTLFCLLYLIQVEKYILLRFKFSLQSNQTYQNSGNNIKLQHI